MELGREVLLYFTLTILASSLIIQGLPPSLGVIDCYVYVVNLYNVHIFDKNYTKRILAYPISRNFIPESEWKKCRMMIYNDTLKFSKCEETVTGEFTFERPVMVDLSYFVGHSVYRRVIGGYLKERISISCYSKSFAFLSIKSSKQVINVSLSLSDLPIDLIELERQYSLPDEYSIAVDTLIVYHVNTGIAEYSGEDKIRFLYLRVHRINEQKRKIMVTYHYPIIVIHGKGIDPTFTLLKRQSFLLSVASLMLLLTYIALPKMRRSRITL